MNYDTTGPDGMNADNAPLRSLSDADARAIDALLAQRAADATAKGSGQGSDPYLSLTDHADIDPQRLAKAKQLLGLLDTLEDDPDSQAPGDLTERTLERIQQARQSERFAQQVQMLSGPRSSFGLSEVLSVAAVLLIAVSLAMPMLSRSRSDAQRLACQTNLATAGMGFGRYAQDNQGALPQTLADPTGTWWDVGSVQQGTAPVRSNSAHLYVLVRGRYVQPQDLSCPSNAHAADPAQLTTEHRDWPNAASVSFSYQNQKGRVVFRIDRAPHTAVLADRNPLFITTDGQKVRFNTRIRIDAPSHAHGNTGQNVLLATGGVNWTVKPMIALPLQADADNIWTARGVRSYTGTEEPADEQDSFLVP